MPDIASVLKQEITRLARKEVAATARQQSKQIQSLKAATRNLRDQVATLEKTVLRLSREISRASQPQAEAAPDRALRISPKSIKSHRRRLGLSQAQMAKLLGVSSNSVTLWESGKASPRGKNRQAIAELRQMGAREAKVLLESL